MKHALFACLLASPLAAETPMTGAEFEALVEGRTLTFSGEIAPYGIEYYAPNRRVVWQFIGEPCINGRWFETTTKSGQNICFVYEDEPEPQCWQFFLEGNAIRAEFMNTPGTTILYEATESEPLICGGVGA